MYICINLFRWWKELDLTSDLPFPIRDRVVKGYFWGLGIFYEPQMSLAKDIFLKMFKVASVLDDLYDAFGTLEELESFEKALKRYTYVSAFFSDLIFYQNLF